MYFFEFGRAVFRHWWALMSCAIFTLLGAYVFYADKSNKWALWATGGMAIFCLLVACYLAWRDEHIQVVKYAENRPKLALEINSLRGIEEWQKQADERESPVWFWVEHLSGRVATSVNFDALKSSRGAYTLHLTSLSYVKPGPRYVVKYELRNEENPIDVAHLGWGTFLMHFFGDTDSKQDNFSLVARYMDGEEECTQTFKFTFKKAEFVVTQNTMHT